MIMNLASPYSQPVTKDVSVGLLGMSLGSRVRVSYLWSVRAHCPLKLCGFYSAFPFGALL